MRFCKELTVQFSYVHINFTTNKTCIILPLYILEQSELKRCHMAIAIH